MKPGAVIAIVIGVVAVIYYAFSRGIIGSGAVVTPGGILAPQPSSNYSGYLAATTAPQVSGILNTVLSGVNSGLHSWLAPSSPSTPAPAQSASPNSPSLAAQPSGPSSSAIVVNPFNYGPAPVGPQVDAGLSYNFTPMNAFDYGGLAAQNTFDPAVSLEGNFATAGA